MFYWHQKQINHWESSNIIGPTKRHFHNFHNFEDQLTFRLMTFNDIYLLLLPPIKYYTSEQIKTIIMHLFTVVREDTNFFVCSLVSTVLK